MARTSTRVIAWSSGAAALLLLVLTLLCLITRLPIGMFTRDPTAYSGAPPYTGLLSNLGILVWSVPVAVCAFTGCAFRSRLPLDLVRFLLASAAVTLMLLLDDLFQIHESLAGADLGLPEKVVLAPMGLAVLAYFVACRRPILASRWPILAAAMVFLAISVVVDVLEDRAILWRLRSWTYLLEDGTKFCGIVNWCCFFVVTSRDLVEDVLAGEAATRSVPLLPQSLAVAPGTALAPSIPSRATSPAFASKIPPPRPA